MEKKNSIEKSVSSPNLGNSPGLYEKYKVNKEQGQSGFKFDMIQFMENYKRGVELYNSYGLQEDKKKKVEERPFPVWDGRRDD